MAEPLSLQVDRTPTPLGEGVIVSDDEGALRLLAQLNGLALDDKHVLDVALETGADVPVCLASRACDMTGVGETLMPLSLPIMPCVLVNPRLPVATKDVFSALGLRNATPFGLQADIMNGVDLSPQYVTLQNNLLEQRKVAVFVYNQQVVDSVTEAFLAKARTAEVPVVGVYETMPRGYSYQAWMLAEVHALERAITAKTSTENL